MKNTPDQAAVTAIAAAAFLAYNPSYGSEMDMRFPEAIVEEPIGLEGFIHTRSNEASDAAVWASLADFTSAFRWARALEQIRCTRPRSKTWSPRIA
jgi:hypothetical protein